VDNKFLANLGFSTVAKFAIALLGFGTQVLLSRLLEKSEFGIISTLGAFTSYFALMADYSTSTVTQTDILKEKEKAAEHYHVYVNAKTLTTLVAIVLFIFFSYILDYAGNRTILLLLAFSIPLTAFVTMPQVLLVSFNGFKTFSTLMLITAFLNCLIQGIGIWLHPAKETYFACLVGGNLAALGVNYWVIGRRFPMVFKWNRTGWDPILALLRKSTPILMGSFFYLLFYRINTIVLERMSGAEAVAEYNLAWMIGNNVMELCWTQFIIIYYPKMVELFGGDKVRLLGQLRKVTIAFFLFFAFTMFVTHFLGAWIFTSIFGEKYAASAKLFEFMLPSLFFTVVFALYYRVLIILEKQTLYMVLMAAGSIVNLGLGLVLIRRYGNYGALGANFAAQFLVSLIIYFFAIRYTRKAVQATQDGVGSKH
jgi:O-antigen/teichoic acid export membrane protein